MIFTVRFIRSEMILLQLITVQKNPMALFIPMTGPMKEVMRNRSWKQE